MFPAAARSAAPCGCAPELEGAAATREPHRQTVVLIGVNSRHRATSSVRTSRRKASSILFAACEGGYLVRKT